LRDHTNYRRALLEAANGAGAEFGNKLPEPIRQAITWRSKRAIARATYRKKHDMPGSGEGSHIHHRDQLLLEAELLRRGGLITAAEVENLREASEGMTEKEAEVLRAETTGLMFEELQRPLGELVDDQKTPAL
jgi:hypothetical protein